MSWCLGFWAGFLATIENLHEPRCKKIGSRVWGWKGRQKVRLLAPPEYHWARHTIDTAHEIWHQNTTAMHLWRTQLHAEGEHLDGGVDEAVNEDSLDLQENLVDRRKVLEHRVDHLHTQ